LSSVERICPLFHVFHKKSEEIKPQQFCAVGVFQNIFQKMIEKSGSGGMVR
jgi:hypothetical protein